MGWEGRIVSAQSQSQVGPAFAGFCWTGVDRDKVFAFEQLEVFRHRVPVDLGVPGAGKLGVSEKGRRRGGD